MDHYSPRVTLNIGGQRFTTYSSTLKRLPGTRLATLATVSIDYDAQLDEYFFDRNPRLFPYILDAFRYGALHFPHCMCAPSVRQEMEFWGIPEELMASCCWRRYREYEEDTIALASLDDVLLNPAGNDLVAKPDPFWKALKHRIYEFLEQPKSSLAATIWSYIYIAILLVSIVTLLLETEPLFRVPRNPTLPTGNDTNRKMLLYMTTRQHPALLWMGIVTTVIFCVELVIRFMVWPKPWRFLLEFYNVVDALSIVPLTVTMVISHTLPGYWTKSRTNLSAIFAITAVTSVGRSVRIFKIVRHNRALRVLALALQASFQELLLLLMLVVIGMVVFSTAIYYAEFYRDGDEFQTIPVGFWWAVITMTTVGYGDVYPTTTAGHAVGCACALAGILITGLPIPVIASNFNRFYGYAKLRDRISNRKRKKIKLRLGEMASSSESDAQSQGNAAPT